MSEFDSSAFDTKLAELRRHASAGSYQWASHEIEAMLQAMPAEGRLLRAKGLALLAECYTRTGDLRASVRCATEAVGLAERLEEEGLLTDTLTGLSFIYGKLSMGRDALETGLRALSLARKLRDPVREAWALNRVGIAYAGLENTAQACASTEQALEIAQALHADDAEFFCLNNLAYFWLRRAEDIQARAEPEAQDPDVALTLTRAREAASLACTMARAVSSPYQVAVALSNLVDALLKTGRSAEALPVLNEFGHLAHDHGYRALALESDLQRAVYLRLSGNAEQAAAMLEALLRASADARPKMRRNLLQALYETRKQQGRHEAALEALEQVMRLQRQMRHDTLTVQTEVLLIREQVEAAQARADHALARLERERARALHLEYEHQQLRAHAQALDRAAHEDVLTGLHNRRHADYTLPVLLDTARHTGHVIALALIDVDHFKQINDGHGHAIGDAVLAELAQLLRQRLRSADLLARLGGEEFVAALVGNTLVQTTDICERLRLAVAAHDWDRIAPGLTVRVSIGLAGGNAPDHAATLLERADQALYAAKRGGRNRVHTEALS